MFLQDQRARARHRREHELLRSARATACATIFSARAAADARRRALQVPLLGEIPIDIPTREAGDKGRPISVADSLGAVGRSFADIAERLTRALPV